MAKKMKDTIGAWAFLFGVIAAIAVGILIGLNMIDSASQVLLITLVVIGLIVGFFNITSREINSFLMSGIVLILASVFGVGIMSLVPIAAETLSSLLYIFIPATIVVAVRNVFKLAKN